jgi:hypothetical protein
MSTKQVEVGHTVVTDPNAEGLGGDEDLVAVVLKRKASFTFRSRRFEKAEPILVSPEEAEILLNTNLFVEG